MRSTDYAERTWTRLEPAPNESKTTFDPATTAELVGPDEKRHTLEMEEPADVQQNVQRVAGSRVEKALLDVAVGVADGAYDAGFVPPLWIIDPRHTTDMTR